LGRESAREVVLLRHLVSVLKKLNPKAPAEAIDAAVNELTRDRSVMSLAAANREVYAADYDRSFRRNFSPACLTRGV